MKKIIKLIKRIFTTIIVSIFIIFFINVILNIKHSEEIKETVIGEWDWNKEASVIYYLLEEKYPSKDDERYPLIMRKDNEIPKKEKDEKRILVVGDSFIYGFGGDNINYIWWKQLNLQIKEAGYSNVNVYGAGMHGLNTEEQLELVLKNDDLMKKIDPDLVIMGYVTNDPDQRDADGKTVLKEDWEVWKYDHPIYKKSESLYHEIVDHMNSLGVEDEEKLRELGDLLGFYRWDIRRLMITEGENLEYYRKVLKDVDNRMKELNIPYFYMQSDNSHGEFVDRANDNVYNLMKELKIKIYTDLDPDAKENEIDPNDYSILWINPIDAHPGIIWTYECGKYAFEILKKDYKFLFENAKMQDINELELNINDTMPLLNITKKKNNVFEFNYPKYEESKTDKSKFLYYPIEKNYIKLNLEYPKEIEKIVITGKNLESAEVYVNTIDPEYGFDINEAREILTPCEYIKNNTYEVDNKITSVNITATFSDKEDRNIEIKFIEKD